MRATARHRDRCDAARARKLGRRVACGLRALRAALRYLRGLRLAALAARLRGWAVRPSDHLLASPADPNPLAAGPHRHHHASSPGRVEIIGSSPRSFRSLKTGLTARLTKSSRETKQLNGQQPCSPWPKTHHLVSVCHSQTHRNSDRGDGHRPLPAAAMAVTGGCPLGYDLALLLNYDQQAVPCDLMLLLTCRHVGRAGAGALELLRMTQRRARS